jgi:uncharacterized BrkB/YihY/UPF0761 family membrane protein
LLFEATRYGPLLDFRWKDTPFLRGAISNRFITFYPTILIVIAFLYALFALIAGSTQALLAEFPPIVLFVLAAVIGFKKRLLWAAGGLIAHGVFDFVHPRLIQNPGVPAWWPGFCMTYDVIAGAYLACLIKRRKIA